MRFNNLIAFLPAVLIATLSFTARATDPAPAAPRSTKPVPVLGGTVGIGENPESQAGQNSSIGIAPGGNKQNTPGQTNIVNVPAPISRPTINTGLFPEFGNKLLERGIDFHGVLLDRFLANPSAGSQTGNTYNLGIFRPTVDIDLEKLIGLPGGNIHVAENVFFLRSGIPSLLVQTGGVIDGYQTTPLNGKTVLSLLTYEQKLLDGRLSIEAGRTNVHRYFFIPNSLDPFSYDSPALNANADFNSFPFGVWGGKVTYRLTPAWYVQAGAFEDNYRRAVNKPYVLGTRDASGAQVLGEVGYRTEFDTDPYPANMELGFLWNTRGNELTNRKGTSLTATPATVAANYPGGGVIFFQGGKVVWRGAGGGFGPPKNVQVFGSLNVAVEKPQPLDMDALLGVNFTGFIPGRPLDAFGLQGRYQRLSQIEASFEQRARRRVGSLDLVQPCNSLAFEAIARIAVAPGTTLSPFVQYYVNPDNYEVPFQRNRGQDGFMAGIFGTIALGPALGTSRKPF